MHLSLRNYLASGRLPGITQGATKADIQTLLGPPKDVSVENRKRPKPAIWKYDSLEIFFRHPEREEAHSVMFNAMNWPDSAFVFPTEWTIDDWDLRFGQPKHSILEYLNRQGFVVSDQESLPLLPCAVRVVASGVGFYFDEDDTLWSIGGTLAETNDVLGKAGAEAGGNGVYNADG